MINEKEIERILQNHEERIKKIESLNQPLKDKMGVVQKFEGLGGGLNFLIEQNFLMQLKSAEDIWSELKREGYVYPITSVRKIINVDFVNKKKKLNRIKDSGVWKYALRK